MSEIPFLSANELARKIRDKELSSVELLEHYLGRVDKYNGDLNAIIVQMREGAMERAKQADAALARGETWGPLHGVPMTVKESYTVTGTPSTWGVPERKNNIAESDALAVRRLQAAGVIVFGKTNVPLMLADFQSYNEIYGTTNNPWDLSRTPGGSSGGSAAALAAGLTGLEIGSDIGGSIRNPAHFSGVFGHKPTWNLIPPRGHAMPGVLTPSDISVIGPLARSAADLETAVTIMAGPDEIQSRGFRLDLQRLGKGLGELRVAVWRNDDIAPVDNEVAERVDRVAEVMRAAGAHVDFDARPAFTSDQSQVIFQSLLSATMTSRLPPAQYDHIVANAEKLDPADDSIEAKMQRARVPRFREWSASNEQRTHLRWAWHEFFNDYDVLLTPIMATPAFPHDHRPFHERTVTVNNEPQPYFTQGFWAGLTGVSYLPSTVIPTGPSRDGLPIGVQIAGPEYGDLLTIGVAEQLEAEGFTFVPAPGYP